MAQSSAQSSVAAAALRIGTRGSPLALAQATTVQARLAAALGFAVDTIEICVIRTTGDRIQDRSLADAGGKGLFTKEIEEALADRRVDIAVHSAKDLPTFLPPGMVLAAFLPREDVRDVFISRTANTLADLPQGAVIGTSSPRRAALVRRQRPDLRVIDFRGNVETRLRKIEEGVAAATLLALAGLKRLGLTDAITSIFDVDTFLPAAGQGAIAIETRDDDSRSRDIAKAVNDEATETALHVERAFLGVLDGSCRTPIAGHARVTDGRIQFRGMVLRPDGSDAFETSRDGAPSSAADLGADAGHELKTRAGPGFFAA